MSELKPCPFCGGKAILNVIEPHTHRIATFMLNYKGGAFVECSNCTAGVSCETEQEAIAAWNRRADGWIPVTEQEPPDSGVYLVCEKRLGVRVAYEDEWRAIDWQVTHWMPLPEPPKGE